MALFHIEIIVNNTNQEGNGTKHEKRPEPARITPSNSEPVITKTQPLPDLVSKLGPWWGRFSKGLAWVLNAFF